MLLGSHYLLSSIELASKNWRPRTECLFPLRLYFCAHSAGSTQSYVGQIKEVIARVGQRMYVSLYFVPLAGRARLGFHASIASVREASIEIVLNKDDLEELKGDKSERREQNQKRDSDLDYRTRYQRVQII